MKTLSPLGVKARLRAFTIIMLISATQAMAQTMVTTPAAINDSIFLCSGSNTTVDFSVAGGQSSQSFSWDFGSATPPTATGAGPHSVSFSTPGVYSAKLYVFTNGSPTDTQTVYVNSGSNPALSFNPSQSFFCANAGNFTLDGHNPPGGYFSGPGVSNGVFDPAAAGNGDHTIWYYYQNGGCLDSASTVVTVGADLSTMGTVINYNGYPTYTKCAPAGGQFNFFSSTDTNNYTSYSLDFGDGSPVQSGSSFPSYITHNYGNTGLFQVVLSLSTTNGCTAYDTLQIFYGSNPSVGLSIKGNNIKCLPRDSSGITFAFPISNIQNNPPGTIYIVEVNDGSPPVTYNHPPPDSILHTFYEPSCGYNTVNFQNAFQVKITAQTPCQPSSVATVEPIFISDPPTAEFTMPPRVCLGEVVNILDQSWGSVNAVNGCDTNVILAWEIAPGSYNLTSGSLGNTFGSNDAVDWIPGSDKLSVRFTKPGWYSVSQFVGNQAGCETDTLTKMICVDSVASPSFAMVTDTVCSSDTVDAWFMNQLISQCDTTDLTWSVSPPGAGVFLTPDTDSNVSIYFGDPGNYNITVTSDNLCYPGTFSQSIYIIGPPSLSMPDDQVICSLDDIDFKGKQNRPDINDSNGTLSYQWDIYPPTGWNFTSGSGANDKYPVISLDTAGTYTVVLTISNYCGIATDSTVYTFLPGPSILPTPDTLICYGSSFGYYFGDLGSNSSLSYDWKLVPGGKKTNGDSLFISNITNSQKVQLTATDTNGCSISSTFNIDVSPELTANAGGPIWVCRQDTAFINASISGGVPPYSYYWLNAAGLRDSNSLSPYRLPADSAASFQLVVTDSLGCSDTDLVSINIHPLPGVDAGPDLTVCFDSLLSPLNGHSPKGGSWAGSGVVDSTFNPIIAGLGTHTLYYHYRDANGCYNFDSTSVTVISSPVAAFSLSGGPGCGPLLVQAYDSSTTGVNHRWYVNDSLASTAANPAFNLYNNNPASDSIFTIKLVVTAGSGCSDSSSQQVTVYSNPQANFSLPGSTCPNVSLQASQNSKAAAGSTYQWLVNSPYLKISNDTVANPWFSFGDNQSAFDSTYSVTLIVISPNGCSDTSQQNITLNSRPIATFSMPAAACGPLVLNPYDSSSGNGLNYAWRVSPAIAIQGAANNAPTFIFPSSNNDSVVYTINLLVTDSRGCVDSASGSYTVYPKPLADFSASVPDTCGAVNLSFDNLSGSGQSGMDRSSMTFFWDFGNGQTSTDSVPNLNLSNTGTSDSSWIITLIATNAFGCSDTALDTITLHPEPQAVITYSTQASCAPFTLDSNVVNAQVFSQHNKQYYWEVINSQGIIVAQDSGIGQLNYTLGNPGDSVWVRLSASSVYNCQRDTSIQLFYTFSKPSPDFSLLPAAGCSPLSVNVADSSTVGVSQQWFVNDSLWYSGVAVNPSFLFNNSGDTDSLISIKLVVGSGNGCSDSSVQTLLVHPLPEAAFSLPTVVCPGETISLFDSSQVNGTYSLQWSASSSAINIQGDTTSNPTLSFPSNSSGFDSTYTISLLITADGCRDSVQHSIILRAQPLAAFSMPAASCAPVIQNPIDASSGNNLLYQWSVSPAINIQGANHHTPTFSFPASFNDSVVYTIRLVLTDSINGCSDSATQSYVVYPRPTAAFIAPGNHYCGPLTINFSNQSASNQSGMDRSTMSFDWDFGNGQLSTDSLPVVTFSNTGQSDSSYLVRLIATNAFGCSDTTFDTIVVHPAPQASYSASNYADCAPFVIDSNVVSTTSLSLANDSYYWEVINMQGTIVAQDSARNGLSYTIGQPGDSVYIRLTATSTYGCQADTSLQLFYALNNPDPGFSALPDSGCSPMTVSVSIVPDSAITRRWYLNDSLYYIGSNPQFNLINTSRSQDSTVVLKQIVQSGSGCMDSSMQSVVIHPVPDAGFSMPTGICPGDTIYPTDTSVASIGYRYRWYASSSAVNISNDTVASPGFYFPDSQSGYDSTYQVSLVISTPGGCTDSISHPITIFSRPLADFGMPAGACAPLNISPIDLSSGQNLSYQWQVWPAITAQNLNTASPVFDFPVSSSDSVVYQIRLFLTDSVKGCSDTLDRNFVVYPKPTAAFTPSRVDSCGPFSVTFSNQSTANQSGMDRSSMTFTWDFGNGQSSSDSVPVVSFTNSGLSDSSYVVRLIATNAFGCSDTTFDTITVHPDPQALFSAATLSDCAPFVIDTNIISFNDYPGANNGYRFQFVDPDTDSVLVSYSRYDSLLFSLPDPGDSVLFRMVALSAFGCTSDTSEIMFHTVGRAPIGFTVSSSAGCSPLLVSLADTGNGFSAWEWYVDGVLVSQLKNPTLSFSNSSTSQDSIYTVKLIATAGNGCPDSVLQTIRVYAQPDPAFSVVNACVGDSLLFSNLSSLPDSIASWQWDFGDGNSDTAFAPQHRYSVAGQYLVSLTATTIHGCSYTFSDTAVQYPQPQANFRINNSCGLDSACAGQAVSFFDSTALPAWGGNVVQWEWDIYNDGSIDYVGANPSHTFANSGIVAVRMIATSQHGCKDTVIRNITIYGAPVANFEVDNGQCGPFVPTVSDSSSGLINSYQWEIFTRDGSGQRVSIHSSSQSDPNPIPPFYSRTATDSTYYIELTVANCCGASTYLDSVVMLPKPVAYTLPSTQQGCTPLDVNFQLDGQVQGLPDYLVFNYGDGSPLDTIYRFYQIGPNGDTNWVWGQNQHRFVNNSLQSVTYQVAVTAINPCGDSTVYTTITVHPSNVQAFISATPQVGCAPLSVTFQDQSFGGINTSWCLDYDSISGTCLQTAVGDSLVHTYTAPGTYLVAQFVNDGCSADTAYTTITVYPSPEARFVHSASVCESDTIFFSNLSLADSNAAFSWDFGDGSSSILKEPYHVYYQAGSFPVRLRVTGPNGCPSDWWDTVRIYDKPAVSFYAANACFNQQPIAFYDSTSLNSGQIISTLWKFGDGNTSVSANPQHSYASPGAYQVTLIHVSSYGCMDSSTQVVNVFPSSLADFNSSLASSKTCGAPQSFIFQNASSNAAGYYWDFDYNGQRGVHTSTLNNPQHTYLQDGVYTVMLVASNTFGCPDTIFKTVLVRPVPIADFSADVTEGCAPLTVNFNDESVYNFAGPGGIVKWTWDFGDGNYAYDVDSVTHTYQNPGEYTVSLYAETDAGCGDSVTYQRMIRVLPTPVPLFTMTNVNAKTVQFNNLTTNVTAGTSFFWDFGDGSTSTEMDPSHTYNVDLFEKDFTFTVCLATFNEYACGDTVCNDVQLNGYLLFTPNAFAPDLDGAGEARYFLPKGHSMSEYHLKIFDEWGNIMFESTSLDENGMPDEPWDGTNARNGVALPMGGYVWQIDAIMNDGTIWEGINDGGIKKRSYGTVTLLR